MQKSRTINLHLITGNPLGGKIISFSNSTILGVAFSRKDFDIMKNRPEINRSGVYFLIGENENSDPMVYIGQTTMLADRIKDHYNNTAKDFWNHLVAFTTSDNSFTEADIIFLEKELIKRGTNAGRYEIENRTQGNNPLVNEFRVSDLNEYIEDLKILLSSLGFQVLQERVTKQDERKKYFCKRNGLNGMGYYTAEGFLVLKGSIGTSEIRKHAPKSFFTLQERLLSEKIIERRENTIIFLKDYIFTTPSASAGFIIGTNANGWIEWKTEDGKTLDENERK